MNLFSRWEEREIYADGEVRVLIREVVMKRTAFWVAETNGELAGFLSVDGQSLEHMYVHPEFQRRKVGTRLRQPFAALLESHMYGGTQEVGSAGA